MSFPEVHLDAINKQAALLLSGAKPASEPVLQFKSELTAKFKEVDQAIASIQHQLAERGEARTAWSISARYALRQYKQQRSSLRGFLSTTNQLLDKLDRERARQAKTERQKVEIERDFKARELAIDAKLQRIQLANNETERWCRAFKKVCKANLDGDLYLRLVAEANALCDSERQP